MNITSARALFPLCRLSGRGRERFYRPGRESTFRRAMRDGFQKQGALSPLVLAGNGFPSSNVSSFRRDRLRRETSCADRLFTHCDLVLSLA